MVLDVEEDVGMDVGGFSFYCLFSIVILIMCGLFEVIVVCKVDVMFVVLLICVLVMFMFCVILMKLRLGFMRFMFW